MLKINSNGKYYSLFRNTIQQKFITNKRTGLHMKLGNTSKQKAYIPTETSQTISIASQLTGFI